MTNNVYFYKAWIMRDGQRVCREGTVQASVPMAALDTIANQAVNEWKRPLLRVELYEINDMGVLVATSTVHERIDAVLTTHKELGTGKCQRLIKAREERKETKALPAPDSHGVKREPYVAPITDWNWMSRIGIIDHVPSFATLKLNEGAFK